MQIVRLMRKHVREPLPYSGTVFDRDAGADYLDPAGGARSGMRRLDSVAYPPSPYCMITDEIGGFYGVVQRFMERR